MLGHNHLHHHDTWWWPWPHLEKPIQGLKRRAALVSGPLELVTLFLDNTWVFFPLLPVPSLLPRLSYTFGVSHPNWVENLICELGSLFSILCPSIKACAIPVSAWFNYWLCKSNMKITSLAETGALYLGYQVQSTHSATILPSQLHFPTEVPR